MNQILVTEKLYITPELRRKKKIYKIKLFLSVFLICILCSYYIYAENDRTKSEEVSKLLLADLEKNIVDANTIDDTTRNLVNDVLIVTLNANDANNQTEEESITNNSKTLGQTYSANNGEEYTIDARLTIPSLDIDYPVISKTSEELLKISLNKYWGPEPNQVGNYCIVGHNYANGKLFGKLSQMEIGDIAKLEANGKKVSYEAYDKYIVEPTDVSCTSQLTGRKREITLITCKNYGTQRLVIKCREIE